MKWDDVAPTITRFCHNPSKGRFLHPEQNRAITVYEAMRLQSFPPNYKFPKHLSMSEIASLIGEALPPKFAEAQARHIAKHLEENLVCTRNFFKSSLLRLSISFLSQDSLRTILLQSMSAANKRRFSADSGKGRTSRIWVAAARNAAKGSGSQPSTLFIRFGMLLGSC